MDDTICVICKAKINQNSDGVVSCPSCHTPFHKNCLKEFAGNDKEYKCPVCKGEIKIEPDNKPYLQNINIVVENTGKRIPVIQVDNQMTAQELLTALAEKINLPSNVRGILSRSANYKQILPNQSLQSAGVQDDEILIADFERVAGGVADTETKDSGNKTDNIAGRDTKKDPSLSVLFGDVIGKNSHVYPNYSQEFIITTADKLKIFLMEYQEAFKARIDWITPLGILLALIPTLVAADFKQFLGLEPSIWQAIFIIGSVVCFVWLLRAIYLSVKFYKRSSIEYIIQQIKQASEKIEN